VGALAPGLAIGLAIGAASGWFLKPGRADGLPERPSGSNAVLTAELQSAPGFSVVMSDVVIPAGKSVPKHTHPGEEFVYVVEGEAVHVEDGSPERAIKASEGIMIPMGVAHAPRGGERGARAITFRVYPTGEAERTLVE
jgi:quercetin dioxygenase-like cupin family protein